MAEPDAELGGGVFLAMSSSVLSRSRQSAHSCIIPLHSDRNAVRL